LDRESSSSGGWTKQLRRLNKIVFICLCVLAIVFSIDYVTENLRAGQVTVLRDVPYANDKNPAHRLDLFVPLSGSILTGRPLVIWIHGGAWVEGDKKRSPVQVLTHYGYVGASINYRFSQEAKFPAQLQDCELALAWLRKHSREYGIDPKRIGVWGHSAGGHLAAMVGVMSAGLKPGAPGSVQAVCDWAGPTDLSTFISQCQPDNRLHPSSPTAPLAGLLGDLPQKVPDKAQAASPVSWVKAGVPPFLIVHGGDDDLVPVEQAKELYDKLQQVNTPVDLDILKGQGHNVATEETLKEAIRFFDKYLKWHFFSAPPIVVQKN
jgi:acetyl esterase/lipase